MEREGRILCRFLMLVACSVWLYGCSDIGIEYGNVEIRVRGAAFGTRAEMPDEEKITDINLLIFDGNGSLEKSIYSRNGYETFAFSLLKGMRYTVYACANFGHEVKVADLEDISRITFHLAYPDEYREGIPMSGACSIIARDEAVIDMELERLMAKISLQMDRSRLSEGVHMNVTGVRIGNCPNRCRPFSMSRAEDEDDCFNLGFSHDDLECVPLNIHGMDGLSNSLSMYMLENMQGSFSEAGLSADEGKVFREDDPRKDICSFIEIELEYSYGDMASIGSPLVYRFYLGESLNSLDIERNCHYHITVCPEDDGLGGDGWRVDKTGIGFAGKPSLVQYPSDYIVGDIGERIHIGCRLNPADAPFDIGLEYLEDDKAEGIYDYEIDPDGHGVTLTLTGPGRGLIYMEAGSPINDSALFLIEVNLPQDQR